MHNKSLFKTSLQKKQIVDDAGSFNDYSTLVNKVAEYSENATQIINTVISNKDYPSCADEFLPLISEIAEIFKTKKQKILAFQQKYGTDDNDKKTMEKYKKIVLNLKNLWGFHKK